LDERVLRGAAIDLVPQAPDEHVDGAVSVRFPASPDLLQKLIAGDNPPAFERCCARAGTVGVSRALASTNAWTSRGSIGLLDLVGSPRGASSLRVARLEAARTRATSSFIENGLTR
jgi:hypothetical protein